MLTKLDSYISFRNRIDHFISLIDTCIPEIYEMDRDIEKILEIVRKNNIQGIDITEQSIHALLLSIMANAKANRAYYQSLRAIIDALNKFINLSYCS